MQECTLWKFVGDAELVGANRGMSAGWKNWLMEPLEMQQNYMQSSALGTKEASAMCPSSNDRLY